MVTPDRQLILVVEDTLDFRVLTSAVLQASGYLVAEVGNGLEALEYLRGPTLPALIILDLTMPVMDGWQFRREQMGNERLSNIPILIYSCEDDLNLTASALNANGHYSKLGNARGMLQAVQRLCAGSDHQAFLQ